MRWLVRIVVALVIVAVLLLGGLLLLPAERIARIATDRFEAATGRAITVEGPVRPTLWPDLGVSTGRVTVANAPWSAEGPLLTAASLAIGVDPVALIGGDIRITGLAVEAPEAVLEIAADGRTNWDLAATSATSPDAPADEPAEARGIPGIALDEARITAGAVTFIDHATGGRTRLEEIAALLRLPDVAGPAELELSARMNGQSVALEADISRLAAFLGQGAVPVTLAAEIGDNAVAFDGDAGLVPLAAGGRLDADFKDIAAVFALIGQAAPDLPPGMGIAVAGDITVTDGGRLTLRNGTLRLDRNSARAAADLDLSGGRPKLTAQIAAGALDLSALAGRNGGGGGTGGDANGDDAGWSRAPIDVSGLQALDAEVALTAQGLDLGYATLGPLSLLTTLEAGRAVTEIREARAYDGVFTGSVVINSRGGLSLRTNLTGAGLALQPLLRQLAGYERLLATGDLTVNLLAVGGDMHTLMNSLEGDGALSLGKGELRGLDLAGMLRTLNTSHVGPGQKTIFDSVNATFDVAGGVLRNRDLAFAAPLVSATGAGTVGLGERRLDYDLLPVLLEGAGGGQGIRVPLRISGPWADPRFKLDVEALVQQEFGAEIEAVKTRVEEAVTDRIGKELGVEVESLDSLEKTLSEELGRRAGEGVLNLLGR